MGAASQDRTRHRTCARRRSSSSANSLVESRHHGISVENQTPTQQASDEGTCFAWAKTNTGIDPMAPPPPVAVQQTQDPATAGQGAGARGAARGAAGGAAIGAIAGDAGKGAAIGATVGVMKGGANRRAAKEQAAAEGQQAQANAAAQSQAISAQQKATFNKGFSACMEGKGYTSK
jgi:hypothetical protein